VPRSNEEPPFDALGIRRTVNLTEAAHKTAARSTAEGALLDAAERLLVDVGYAGITTRRLAEEAGVNHGLVHYYFGSIENVLLRTLERFTERLIERQRAMYAAPDVPFIEKWRTAMRYLVADDVAYEKVWWELQALSWNHPELREPVARVNDEWRALLTEAFAEPRERYGIEMPLQALVSLVITFNEGIILERLSGIDTGHRELLEWIDGWMEAKERK
jgi:TetR/AcrR family transcriptional regulator